MTPYSSYKHILFSKRDKILTVTINRPDKLNAVDGPLHEELSRVFYDVAADHSVDVVILTGSGRAFSAGGDVNWLQSMIDDADAWNRCRFEAKKIVYGLLDCEKPIIAKLNGHAMGLGATMALFCDVIFAAKNARIGDPHVMVGLVGGDGGAIIWPQLIGYARAKEYLMTGDQIRAEDAERMGLINHAVEDAELDAKVDAFADRLAAGATESIRYTKVSVNIGLRQLAHSILDASLAYESVTNFGKDHQEALNAFKEKRKPKFTGR
ncbi:MAG: enoyl-CoA hydratase-related protein [Hyphomicrobiaceae bacterium]